MIFIVVIEHVSILASLSECRSITDSKDIVQELLQEVVDTNLMVDGARTATMDVVPRSYLNLNNSF